MSESPEHQKAKIRLTDYEEYIEEIDNKIHLGIGRVEGTDDIYIKRFMYFVCQPDPDNNIGCIEERILAKIMIADGWRDMGLNKDESTPIKTRYMKLLQEQYDNSYYVGKQLFPVIRDFVKPRKNGTHDDYEYKMEYYRKRNMFMYDSEDDDY